jgi:acyl-coenzyme A synthetase/AMP-(fatty) acid ligase/3-hydroxymyristoyl/3-hydroxydecanoyl-(acyl carrier protein) dehydratase
MNATRLVPVGASSWRERISSLSAPRIALFTDDRKTFASVLWAAWAEGKQVVLPGDLQPETLKALSKTDVALVGDFPEATVKAVARDDWSGAPFTLDWEGLVLFTSGSTGKPTAIPKKLNQLWREVDNLEATFGSSIDPEATVFSSVSHQHIYGLLFSVLWPVLTGRKLSAHRLEYPEQLDVLAAHSPSVFVSSPAFLKRLPHSARTVGHLQAIFSSGGPLSLDAAQRTQSTLGQYPNEIFGSSETGGIAFRSEPSSAWNTFSGVEVRASALELLEVRSPQLPDDAWFTTADRVAIDGTSFTVLGRADRIAKIEEKRVSLELVERLAMSTGLYVEVRVVPLVGARMELGLVGVLSTDGLARSRRERIAVTKAAVQQGVEPVAVPRKYRFVEALPANAQGKLNEASLQILFSPERPEAIWLERTANRAVVEFSVNPNLRVLDGHFPLSPIVPGVAQLAWAIAWGREAFGASARCQRVDVLKFQRLMVPGGRHRCELEWSSEKSVLTFRMTSTSGQFSSGRVVCTP